LFHWWRLYKTLQYFSSPKRHYNILPKTPSLSTLSSFLHLELLSIQWIELGEGKNGEWGISFKIKPFNPYTCRWWAAQSSKIINDYNWSFILCIIVNVTVACSWIFYIKLNFVKLLASTSFVCILHFITCKNVFYPYYIVSIHFLYSILFLCKIYRY